jgi:hypothetical protein
MAASSVLKRTDDLPAEHRLQALFALAAFGTLKAKKVAYISVPITSGPRLYDYMTEKGFRTPEEAKKDHAAFFEHVVEPNLEQGVKGSDAWARKIDGAVIAPAEFEGRLRRQGAIDWGQDDFMGMWIPLVDEKVTHMIMLDGWQYSNGSGEEYLQAVLMQMGRAKRSNIEILDEKGQAIPLDKGIGLIAEAFKNIHSRGLVPRNMAETLALLIEAERRFSIERKYGWSGEPTPRPEGMATPSMPLYDSKRIQNIARDVTPLFRKHYPDIADTLKKTSSFDFSPLNALFRRAAQPPALPAAKPRAPVLAA